MAVDRIEPTRAIALHIWWSFIWRWIVFVFLLMFGTSFLYMMIKAAVFGARPTAEPDALLTLIGLAIIFGVQIEVFFRLLKKRFKGFELAIVATKD